MRPAQRYTRYPDLAPVDDMAGEAATLLDHSAEVLRWAEQYSR